MFYLIIEGCGFYCRCLGLICIKQPIIIDYQPVTKIKRITFTFMAGNYQNNCVSYRGLPYKERIDKQECEQAVVSFVKKGGKLPRYIHSPKIPMCAGLYGSVGCASDWWSGGCGFDPRRVGNILLWRLIMKYFLRSFSCFRWFKKDSCSFLATILVNRLEE